MEITNAIEDWLLFLLTKQPFHEIRLFESLVSASHAPEPCQNTNVIEFFY